MQMIFACLLHPWHVLPETSDGLPRSKLSGTVQQERILPCQVEAKGRARRRLQCKIIGAKKRMRLKEGDDLPRDLARVELGQDANRHAQRQQSCPQQTENGVGLIKFSRAKHFAANPRPIIRR